MSWNYRILAYPDGEDIYLEVSDVYYEDDKPISHGKASVGGNSISDIEWTLSRMISCLSKPVLWGDGRFPQEFEELPSQQQKDEQQRLNN